MAVNIDEITTQYQNLLIAQYLDKSKARATIDLFTKELLADGIFWQVLDGFDLENAVGVQLDIIGKYVGIDRFFKGIVLDDDAFATNDYADLPNGYGFADYADPLIEGGDLLTYAQVLSKTQKLDDEDYRFLMKLKIAKNNTNHSLFEIATDMNRFFGDKLRFRDNFNMSINYFYDDSMIEIITIAKDKDCLPRPIGVALNLIKDNVDYFSMATYQVDGDGLGFGDYADPLIEGGDLLTYGQIS